MIFKIKNEDVEIKYTFNSFRYMKDFDLAILELLETKPFMAIEITETLLSGGLNWTPNKKFTFAEVETALEDYIIEGDIKVLMAELLEELRTSPFFMSLQRNSAVE